MKALDYEIREITEDTCSDEVLEEIALIHRTMLPDGFLSTLGTPFLKTIYREIAADPNSQLLCAAAPRNVTLGFICGTTSTSSLYRRFVTRNIFCTFVNLSPKLLSYRFLLKISQTLFIPSRNKQNELPAPQLLNFCVSADYQGKGVGRLLFSNLRHWFETRHINEVTITTGCEQQSAQSFYEAHGLQPLGTCSLHKPNDSVIYIWKMAHQYTAKKLKQIKTC